MITSEGSESSTHYLSDKNRFDVSSKGPSSGISVGRRAFGKKGLWEEGPGISVETRADEGPLLETSNLFLSLR